MIILIIPADKNKNKKKHEMIKLYDAISSNYTKNRQKKLNKLK